MKINKSFIIKIVSIVLVLCTLITICIIPASASESSFQYFSNAFPLDLVYVRLKNSNEYVETKVSKLGSGNYATNNDVVFAKYQNLLLANPFDLISFQSQKVNFTLNKGDTFTISMSLLAPFCDKMALILYKSDGTYVTAPLMFSRSSALHTDNDTVRRLSGEPLAYGDQKLVYCHEYTLDYQFESRMGDNIYAIAIQAQFNDESQVRKFWICYEDCSLTLDLADENSDAGIFHSFSSFKKHFAKFLGSFLAFVLNFGGTIKSVFTPFFNTISSHFTSLFSRIVSLGDKIVKPITDIPSNISNWFQNTFLGKVLQITNKTKTYVNNSGTGVEYAALDDEVGESTENSQNWDLKYSPNHFIDVEYYSNLIPNVFDSGG